MLLTTVFFKLEEKKKLNSSFKNGHFSTISGHFFAIYISIFHKTEIMMVILRCLVWPNLNLIKIYDMLLLKIFFFMHYFGAKIPKKVLTTQKKTSCHVFKMGIFSKLFVAVMAHIIRENADKRIKLFLIFFQLKIVDKLLSSF